jgi:hypothetical protein
MIVGSEILTFFIGALFLALPIALLEILMEKDKGWGSDLSKKSWYGRVVGEKNLVARMVVRILGVPHLFGYFVFMYFVLVPVLLVAAYFLLIQEAWLLVAIYFGVLVLEDFLWFVLNWNFPALKELLKGPKGKIWWHKRWVRLGGGYLPRSYFLSLPFIVIALILS